MMMLRLALAVAALAMALPAAAAADPTPRLWGVSYATGRGSVVLGEPTITVRVSATLPPGAACADAAAVEAQPVPHGVTAVNPMAAAPVTVVLAPGHCTGSWRDGWIHFVIPYIGATDIIDVSFVTADGRGIAREKIAVEKTGDHGWDD